MPDARPFRLRVLDALTECLQSITPEQGYQHDLSGAVFRGRLFFGNDEPLPMVALLEPPTPIQALPSPQTSVARAGEWDILVQGWVEDDHLNPTDPAYVLAADIGSALAKQRKRRNDILGMGNAVYDLKVGPAVVRPPDEISGKAYFYLMLTLSLAEDLENPFT